MDSTWYYTLSTISQTLAAILALGAVFVVLRLQSLNKNIAEYKTVALNIIRARIKHKNHRAKLDEMSDILKEIREFKNLYIDDELRSDAGILHDIGSWANTYAVFGHKDDIDFVNNTVDRLDFFVSQRDDVIKMIKWPGIFMSSSVILAILFLGVSNYLKYPAVILWFITLFSVFSFYSTVRASWKILDAIKRLE